MGTDSRMFSEAAQAPNVVRAPAGRTMPGQRAPHRRPVAKMSRARSVTLRAAARITPATFAKYLIESHTKLLTTSAAPSMRPLYDAQPDLRGVVFLVISQSGKSPDLLASAENAKRNGACVTRAVQFAGVAARADGASHDSAERRTGNERRRDKSYIASLSAIVHLVASWTSDQTLINSLMRAPDQLEQAWQPRLERSCAGARTERTICSSLGRGYGLGVAQEAALKFKETCGLHAEAFSAAEVKHGPMALVGRGFPVLMLSQNDESRGGIEKLAGRFRRTRRGRC